MEWVPPNNSINNYNKPKEFPKDAECLLHISSYGHMHIEKGYCVRWLLPHRRKNELKSIFPFLQIF